MNQMNRMNHKYEVKEIVTNKRGTYLTDKSWTREKRVGFPTKFNAISRQNLDETQKNRENLISNVVGGLDELIDKQYGNLEDMFGFLPPGPISYGLALESYTTTDPVSYVSSADIGDVFVYQTEPNPLAANKGSEVGYLVGVKKDIFGTETYVFASSVSYTESGKETYHGLRKISQRKIHKIFPTSHKERFRI